MYPPVRPGTSSMVSFVVFFLVSMGVVDLLVKIITTAVLLLE